MSVVLRADQLGPLDEVRGHLAQGRRHVLLQAPTGWGKGTVAAVALARAASNGNPSAFVCHRDAINRDLVERLTACGAGGVRIIAPGGDAGPFDAALTVVSIQTLDARSLSLPHIRVWWYDEAHRCAAASYGRALERHPAATYIGSTATPARGDGRPLSFFRSIVQGPQVQELVAAGLLAPLTVLAPDETLDALADDPVSVYPAGVPGLVFCNSVDHSRELAARLCAERGLRAKHVDAASDVAAAVSDFNAGHLDVLTCYRILTEGVDTRRAKALVFATLMQSAVGYLQAIGRVRRPTGGRATLYDLMGSFHLHGHPDADRTYSIDGAQGIALVSRLVRAVQCKGCLGWSLPAPACPACGHRLPRPQPPRVTKKELRERRLAAQAKEGPEWELWSALVLAGRARGWKPQAAAMQFRAQVGRFPRWSIQCVPEAPEPTAEEAASGSKAA